MYNSKTIVDGVSGFSPTREKWVAKPVEDLPEKVAVSFKTGQTGHLDMKSPIGVHWANVVDRLAKANRPVYVEVDEESKIITKVLIPRIYKVKALEPNDQGNVRVRLDPSAAVHLLLQSDPNYGAILAKLQTALDDDSELLITETRDEHEIIDVRPPTETTEGPSDPAPAPPDDPPVSEARAQELYNDMNAKSCVPCSPGSDCIPFLYPDNGCWIRAHKMCYLMMDEGETPEKVWIRGNLVVPTPNHPDCSVSWWYHVAPTLTLDTSGNPKTVIDPSVSPAAESKTAWKNRQGDPGSTLDDTVWTQYGPYGGTATLQQTNQDLDDFRDYLLDRCLDFGPPPYNCTRNSFFIIDRNNFSDDEIEAMLSTATPAVIEAALYIIFDGFSPTELGFTSATMEKMPDLDISPSVSGMTITADRLEFAYPTHLNRRQRLTWVYNINFTNTSAFTFTGDRLTVTLQASLPTVTVSSTGYLYLIKQPNPYEIDGATSWLSTDLRVFQIKTGESKLGATMGSDPSAFATQVITNLNTGNTGGPTFDDISTNQQTSRLELSQTVGGTPVYNFAVAKVRYRSHVGLPATGVRVFFRLFPVATTSLEYDQATTYRRREAGGTVIPLLGIKNNEVAAIPCFAAPRIDSAATSMTTQTDAANVLTIPPDAGSEVTRYFGCWLDINQTQPQFPIQPSPVDGPYSANRKSIQDLIRNEHQCLVSEIAFTPAPAQGGSTPSISDKLAQRNLAIVESANPGSTSSRRIPQTFEIRPSTSRLEPDELMIDWGNVPAGSFATIYIPGIDTNDILLLAGKKYRSHGLVRIDEHTLKSDAGGITYLPIPFVDANLPGMLTVNLPEGIESGQAFTIVVRQVTGEQHRLREAAAITKPQPDMRYIVGSFQITIPVHEKAAMLVKEERLLSNLRWIEAAIPGNNRWSPVFGKYVMQIADRVDALGGNSKKVAASPSGEWEEAYRRCFALAVITILLIAMLVVGTGTLSTGLLAAIDVPILALIIAVARFWIKRCRPRICTLLRTLLLGTGIGAIILGIIAVLGTSNTQLITTLIISAGVTSVTAVVGWVKRCFRLW